MEAFLSSTSLLLSYFLQQLGIRYTLQHCSTAASLSFSLQAVGACSLVARLGGITSLLLDLLKVYWLPAPVFIMGVVATCAGALAIFFPETLGEKLPETKEEASM